MGGRYGLQPPTVSNMSPLGRRAKRSTNFDPERELRVFFTPHQITPIASPKT
jgi:hypothetical protein